MIITKVSLPRRTFLRGVGASLALPLLDAMVPALTAAKTAAAPVRRLGVVYVPNGIAMDSWTPKAQGAAFELTPILQPLAPFRDRMVVVSGLDGAKSKGSHSGAASQIPDRIRRNEQPGRRAGEHIDRSDRREGIRPADAVGVARALVGRAG